jgi:hypothetical protein
MLRQLPRHIVEGYESVFGGNREDINRVCQLVADSIAVEFLSGIPDVWGPIDDKLKAGIRQRVIDAVNQKFHEWTAEGT